MKQEIMGWHWYQVDLMQIIFTSLQTDNHTSSLNFVQAGCFSWHPTNTIEALKTNMLYVIWFVSLCSC